MNLTILGAGPAGYVAAVKAARLKANVTIIEEKEVGGTCLNWGCIPTKALVASSRLFTKMLSAKDFGIEIQGEIIPNFSKIMERKNRIVNTQIKGIRTLLKSWGINIKEGRGILKSPEDIDVLLKDGTKEKINSDKILIATGSRPLQIPVFPFDGKRVISSDDAVTLNEIPKSLIIIGAGVTGCEFACIFRGFGSEVTILEMLPRALASEDVEISELLEREFKKKGIKFLKNIKAEKMRIIDNEVDIMLSDGKEIAAEKVLVAAGRTFNSDGIGTEEAGIKKGSKGEIIVNDKMETNIPGVFAVGDVIGGLLLAHVASHEGITAAINATGGNKKIDYSAVPSAIFTTPEIASVGLREYQADEQEIRVKTGHFPFRTLGKAHAEGEIEGFVKVVCEEKSEKVLGVHIIGSNASDIIHEGVLAVKNGLTIKDISETIHIHPTFSEAFKESSEDVRGEAIHIPKR